jgi:hypothetical protein
VSGLYVARSDAGRAVDRLAGQALIAPRPAQHVVELEHISWHGRSSREQTPKPRSACIPIVGLRPRAIDDNDRAKQSSDDTSLHNLVREATGMLWLGYESFVVTGEIRYGVLSPPTAAAGAVGPRG